MICSFELYRRKTRTWPHGSAVAGRCVLTFSATFENNVGSIRLLANGAFKAICRPPLQAGEVMVVQSPLSIWSVGTNSRLVADWRSEERRVGKECRSRWSPYH